MAWGRLVEFGRFRTTSVSTPSFHFRDQDFSGKPRGPPVWFGQKSRQGFARTIPAAKKCHGNASL
jgi:hypothetical protein